MLAHRPCCEDMPRAIRLPYRLDVPERDLLAISKAQRPYAVIPKAFFHGPMCSIIRASTELSLSISIGHQPAGENRG